MKYGMLSLLIFGLVITAGCSPKVGSDAWCEDMKEKPKKQWTFEETGEYTKHCVFNQKPDEEK